MITLVTKTSDFLGLVPGLYEIPYKERYSSKTVRISIHLDTFHTLSDIKEFIKKSVANFELIQIDKLKKEHKLIINPKKNKQAKTF